MLPSDGSLAKERISAYLESYKSARQEIIDRIKQRDLLYSYYLLAIGGLAGVRTLGFALEDYDKYSLVSYFDVPLAPLTIYPFLSLFFCSIVAQHQIQIGKLGFFCDVILSRGKLKSLLGEDFLNWETEGPTYKLGTLSYFERAHQLLFFVPSIIACIAQSSLLYFSFIPKWYGLSVPREVIYQIQQHVSIISVSVLNIISWYFFVKTYYLLRKSQLVRKSMGDARRQINDDERNIVKYFNKSFADYSNHVEEYKSATFISVIISLSIAAHLLLFVHRSALMVPVLPPSVQHEPPRIKAPRR